MYQIDIPGLISDIYEAPGDPTAWDRVTVKLAEAFRSEYSQMIVFDEPSHLLCNFVNGRVAGEEWTRDYALIDTAVQRVGQCAARVPVTQFDVMNDEELKRCPVQQEFLPKYGVEHRLWITGAPAPGLTQVTALIRSSGHGPFEVPERDLFASMQKHLQRAMNLHLQLTEAHLIAATLEKGLDLLSTGTVLLDAAGTVLFCNLAARALLDARNGVCLNRVKLAGVTQAANLQLQLLLARALGRVGVATGGVLAIERALGRPLIVRIFPVRLPTEVLPPRAAVIVLLRDPDRGPQPDEAVLALMGLTRAERRLVAALVAGSGLEEYAAQAGLSVHTVRSVLRTVFGKTGTHRQSELVATAMRAAGS